MPTIHIVDITKDSIVKTGERFLNVQTVIKDGEAEIPRNFGFALDSTTEHIQAELQKALQVYEADKAQATENAEQEAAEASADEAIEALKGATITSVTE